MDLRRGSPKPLPVQPKRQDTLLLTVGTPLAAIFDSAAALERAEASARVLAARAAGHAGAPRAFAQLAAAAPDGLVPTPGRGAAHVARQIDLAADIVIHARDVVGDEIVDAMEWVAGGIRRIASTSDALDTTGVARAARRGVATIRGLVAETFPRDASWDTFRLGTLLPRAAWMSALVDAAVKVGWEMRSDDPWKIVASVAGIESEDVDTGRRLLNDTTVVTSVAYSTAQVESVLLGLMRHSVLSSGHVALARETSARVRTAAEAITDEAGSSTALDRLLDAIGSLSSAVDPRLGLPGKRTVDRSQQRAATHRSHAPSSPARLR